MFINLSSASSVSSRGGNCCETSAVDDRLSLLARRIFLGVWVLASWSSPLGAQLTGDGKHDLRTDAESEVQPAAGAGRLPHRTAVSGQSVRYSKRHPPCGKARLRSRLHGDKVDSRPRPNVGEREWERYPTATGCIFVLCLFSHTESFECLIGTGAAQCGAAVDVTAEQVANRGNQQRTVQ